MSNVSPSKKQLREFGILVGFGFPILIGWLFPYSVGHGFRAWTLFVGAPGLLLGLFYPASLRYPYKIWISIGNVLGWINSHIILGLIFIIILQPIAYIMRLSGYDPLRRRSAGASSFREVRQNHHIDLTRIF